MELKEFKFVTTLVLDLMMNLKIAAPFVFSQGLKQLYMRAILMIYLNQCAVQLYQTFKNCLERDCLGLLIQLW